MTGGTDAAPAVLRLALLGGESSGKTTLAQLLAERLHTVWVPEVGRARWAELRRTLTVDELVDVALQQVAQEDALALSASGWLVCDTTPLTTLQYCLHDHGSAPPALHALAGRHYHLTVLCQPDFDFVQDGCRRDDGFRASQHAWTVERLAAMGVAHVDVSGTALQRVQQVLRALPAAGATRAAANAGAG